jgi:hypothetical protein
MITQLAPKSEAYSLLGLQNRVHSTAPSKYKSMQDMADRLQQLALAIKTSILADQPLPLSRPVANLDPGLLVYQV